MGEQDAGRVDDERAAALWNRIGLAFAKHPRAMDEEERAARVAFMAFCDEQQAEIARLRAVEAAARDFQAAHRAAYAVYDSDGPDWGDRMSDAMQRRAEAETALLATLGIEHDVATPALEQRGDHYESLDEGIAIGRKEAAALIAGLRDCLRECRHALVTYQGLYAHDGQPEQRWQLDDTALIRRIDTALGN